jgi:hypothetical protein
VVRTVDACATFRDLGWRWRPGEDPRTDPKRCGRCALLLRSDGDGSGRLCSAGEEATPPLGVRPPDRTDPRRAASSSGYATPSRSLRRPPWPGFAGGATSERRRRGEARSGHRAGRTVCRPSGRACRPSQRLPRKHARWQVIRSGRFDVSVPPGTRHLHHLEPGTSRAFRGKYAFPSSFWTGNTSRGEKFLQVSLRDGRLHQSSAPSSRPRGASSSDEAPTATWSYVTMKLADPDVELQSAECQSKRLASRGDEGRWG